LRVTITEDLGDVGLEGELLAVAQAAGARLRAETDQDAEAAASAADALMRAASSAMAAGQSLTQITSAEARGKESVRHTLRADALKLVERTGEKARQTQAEHYQAIARATRLGLPMRDIAQAAGVTHGTIRAINNRLAGHAGGAEQDVPDELEPMSPPAEPLDG
jgi:DNA-binding NarL/FixJ family response regulator